MEYTVTNRNKCRLCESSDLFEFMQFDSIPFFDEVVEQKNIGNEFSYPMKIFFCQSCSSVQSQHDVNLHTYYNTYQYVASKSNFIRTYMEELVNYCVDHLDLKPCDKVIEIGAADGFLLGLFNKAGAESLGFEAATNLCELAKENNINVVNALFTRETVDLIPYNFKKAQFVVLLHTFDHLYDPNPFLEDVNSVLDPEKGILLLEVHDLADIYEKKETALFGHEHATYLHFGSMSRLLERNGLRIIDFNFIDKDHCRGSSMLIAATPTSSKIEITKNLDNFKIEKLDQLETFIRFQSNVISSFKKLRDYIDQGKTHGKKFVGYGGWGRGVTTLAMAQLNHTHLDFVVDGNQNLDGCVTPVTNFLIKPPSAINNQVVDEVIVFNYAYINEIKENLQDFVSNGGKIISVIDLLK